MSVRGAIKIKEISYKESDKNKSTGSYSDYKTGETVKIWAVLIHPMDTGFQKDKHSGTIKPAFYIKKITAFFENKKVAEFDISASASANPKIVFPYKITGIGALKVVFENNKGEIMEKSVKIQPK